MRISRLLVLLLIVAVAAADAPPTTADEPYQLTVCLRFADDAIFTRFFTRSVRRQVRDQLENYFGTLAVVEVVPSHPLFEELGSAGLADLSLSPEESNARDLRGNVFLMEVGFLDGVYRVRWRQLHGAVQHLGPLFTRATPDRLWLAKAVCLAVKADFAPVATVNPTSGSSEVGLAFHGADRPAQLAPWLEAGCVLQPFWVLRQEDDSLACKPIPNTFLRVAPGSDGTTATVVSGLADPWQQTARVAGFRALKLTTRKGRFRLRLVNSESGEPVTQNCRVYANSTGFDKIDDKDRLPEPDRKGYVVADRQFDQVAYVKIKTGGEFNLLLPITEEELDRELRIPVDERADEKNDWRRRLRYCVQDLRAIQVLRDQCVRDVNRLNQSKRYEEARERVAEAVDLLRPLAAAAAEDVARMQEEAEEVEMSEDSLLAWTRTRAAELEDRVRQLGELGTSLAEAIEKADKQSRAEALLKLAREAKDAGNFDETIAKYEQALEQWPQLPQVREQLARLKEIWELKGPEHEAARRFVYDEYTQVSTDDLAGVLERAENVFDQLVGFGDSLTATRLMSVNSEHVSALNEIVEMLVDRDSQADRDERETYQKLLEDLLQFQGRVIEFIKARGEG